MVHAGSVVLSPRTVLEQKGNLEHRLRMGRRITGHRGIAWLGHLGLGAEHVCLLSLVSLLPWGHSLDPAEFLIV